MYNKMYNIPGTYTFLASFLVFTLTLQCSAAIRCLSCNDVIQPRHCSGIESCPDGDACVTESYQNKNGETLFNVGCMSAQRCSLNANRNSSNRILRTDIIGTHQRDVCTECCHSDLCNAAGCGMNGFPQQRGPVCLNCPQTRDPADCDVINVCLRDEVCHVEDIFEFGDVFYKTSCVRSNDYQCSSHTVYNPAEIGRRSTRREKCFFCCSDDLCNNKCHASTSPLLTTMSSTTHTQLSEHNATTSYVPSTLSSTTPAPTHPGFKGESFFLMFMQNALYSYSTHKLSVNVTFMAPYAHIEVITRHNTTSQNVSGPATYIDIDADLTMRENGKTGKGVILTSDTPMSAVVFNSYTGGSMDGYLALPTDKLGDSYIVGTFKPNTASSYRKYGTSFAVGAPYDNTVINITFSTSGVTVPSQYHRDGDTITVVLDKLDTFYVETNTAYQDLTGTRIISNKPVAVVSGNVCSYRNGCNHLVEYLPPVSKWGTRFMVPPIKRSTSGIIRIVSSENNTHVVVTSKTSNHTYTFSNVVDIETDPTQPYGISSDRPVLVLLFFNATTIGMSIIPSKKQFSNDIVSVSPPKLSYYTKTPLDNYIVVTIRKSDESGLQLRSSNGMDLPRVGSVTFPNVKSEMYSFITVTCNNKQTCSVQHTDNNVTFSVISYGFHSYEAYAYPANLSL